MDKIRTPVDHDGQTDGSPVKRAIHSKQGNKKVVDLSGIEPEIRLLDG